MKITPRKYAESLLEALEGAPKGKIDVYLNNFLHILESANDIRILPEIIEEIKKIEREKTGIRLATVTTAVPLADAAAKEIAKKLEKIFSSKLKIKNEVNPGILGGIVIESGEDFFDKSVKNYLNKFKESLSS